jgi:ankyrin repeat protein
MAAAELGRIEMVTHLLERGGNVASRDVHGQTALFYALRFKDPLPVLSALFQRGANAAVVDNSGTSLWTYACAKDMSARVGSFEFALRHRRASPVPEVADLLRSHGCMDV